MEYFYFEKYRIYTSFAKQKDKKPRIRDVIYLIMDSILLFLWSSLQPRRQLIGAVFSIFNCGTPNHGIEIFQCSNHAFMCKIVPIRRLGCSSDYSNSKIESMYFIDGFVCLLNKRNMICVRLWHCISFVEKKRGKFYLDLVELNRVFNNCFYPHVYSAK